MDGGKILAASSSSASAPATAPAPGGEGAENERRIRELKRLVDIIKNEKLSSINLIDFDSIKTKLLIIDELEVYVNNIEWALDGIQSIFKKQNTIF